ncbi:MAG TPA: rRNA maturation RNase YbeY [Cyanobacteria bacterium UBA9971]|nr:rRNA maturation RNase YbeY [Cyanobacteria bacterium UBA9971]
MNKFKISITDNQDRFSVNIDKINDIACKMLDYITKDTEIIESTVLNNLNLIEYNLEVDIVFCDDADIQELNMSYRGKDKPTDVLSFALFADNPDEYFIIDNQISLGEIIISTETAKKQAVEREKTFNDEIYFLLSHGILHLLGFDHPDEGTLEDMLALQHEMTGFAVK